MIIVVVAMTKLSKDVFSNTQAGDSQGAQLFHYKFFVSRGKVLKKFLTSKSFSLSSLSFVPISGFRRIVFKMLCRQQSDNDETIHKLVMVVFVVNEITSTMMTRMRRHIKL